MAEVAMPKMGDGMEEGTITAWIKHEGDFVKEGDVIAEVETDKANVEITSYDTGTLSKIVVKEGETVPVGTTIAIIGEAAAVIASTSSNGAKPASSEAPPPIASVLPPPQIETISVVKSGENERMKSSPLARNIAAQLGVKLSAIEGSGPGGRIVERDVRAAAETNVSVGASVAPKSDPQIAKPATTPPASTSTTTTTFIDAKPSKMREAIAKRTVQSKQTIPHFYVTMIVEMDSALALLKQFNADGVTKITVNDLIVKACAGALKSVPEVNSTWTSEGLVRRYSEAHIGIAVGIDDGLIIPVVRDCHAKSLRQISTDAKALIVKARNGQLKPDEYSGGTFSVSNLGMMGIDEFIAIINPPEAAILAIGASVRTPVVKENDEIVIRSLMKISLSADHRLLDGVSAAKFVNEVKKALETPFSLVS